MTTKFATVAFVLFTATSLASAAPRTTGAALVSPNKIVGLWSTAGDVGPCGGPPTMQVSNNLLFHAGGTVTENIAPTPLRNQGLGTWSYDSWAGWQLHLRFDRFADGLYDGYTTVDRTLRMSRDGLKLTGPVHATVYAIDGTMIFELCGEATSTRLQ